MPQNPIPKEETRKDWETVQEDAGGSGSTTQRLRVQQGWLYRTAMANGGVAMVFVPEISRE